MITFERIELAYKECIKKKRSKLSAMEFSAEDLCGNLQKIVDDINNKTYTTSPSTCFVITSPTIREIFAADFRDRIVQHFFVQETTPILDKLLVENTTSCRLNKGTGYALEKLRQFVVEVSNYGKEDCFYLKIDFSGYFMSILREYLTQLFIDIINIFYRGEYREELLYLAPIIYMDDPTLNCILKVAPEILDKVPARKSIFKSNNRGIAIGNITAQIGSNLNLNGFDHYIIENLDFPYYVRYVDDAIILDRNRKRLIRALPLIEAKASESGQEINAKKTKIETLYHGVQFLGKITYPYGYQKLTKETRGRLFNSIKDFPEDDYELLSVLNSRMGLLKYYATYKDIQKYIKLIPEEVKRKFDFNGKKFILKKENNK